MLRPLKWNKLRDGSFTAHAFSGFVAYTIREMKNKRWAVVIGTMHEPAKDTFVEAVLCCETHRFNTWQQEIEK